MNNNTNCTEDFDCPGALWCFKDDALDTNTCDCPNNFGYINVDTDCSDKSFVFYFFLLPTLLFMLIIIITFVYYAIKLTAFFRARANKNYTPALRILAITLLAFFFMFASFAARIAGFIFPDSWVPVEDVKQRFNGPREDYKYSPFFTATIFFQLLYIPFGICAIVETGLLWLEITYNAYRLKTFQRFKRARIIANISYALMIVLAILIIATSDISALVFYGYLGVPYLMLLAVLILLGRFYMLSLLRAQINRAKERSEKTATRGVDSSAKTSKYEQVASSVNLLSLELLLSIVGVAGGCILIFLSVASDNRQVPSGTLDFRKGGMILIDSAFTFAFLCLLWYTLEAFNNILSKSGAESKVNSEFKQPKLTNGESITDSVTNIEDENEATRAAKLKAQNTKESEQNNPENLI